MPTHLGRHNHQVSFAISPVVCSIGNITATATRIDNPTERIPYTYKAIGGVDEPPSVVSYNCNILVNNSKQKEDWAALYTQPSFQHCCTTVPYRWDQGFATAHVVKVLLDWKQQQQGSIRATVTSTSDIGASGGGEGVAEVVQNLLTLYELGPAEYWADETVSGGDKAAVVRRLFALDDEEPLLKQNEVENGEGYDDDKKNLPLSWSPLRSSMMDQLENRGIVLLVPEVLETDATAANVKGSSCNGCWVELVIPHGLVAMLVESEHVVHTENRPKWYG